jgi:hypothetical protein
MRSIREDTRMATAATQHSAGDLDGDTPEQVAWGLVEWIKKVEDLGDRAGLLTAFQESLTVTRQGADDANGAALGYHRKLAFKLARIVAEMEGREPGKRNEGDRAWILQTFAECLEAARGRRSVAAAPTA